MAGLTTFGISGVWGITFQYVLVGANAISLPQWVLDPCGAMGYNATQPYILRFYAGNTGLVTNTLLTGGTSGKTFTPLAITISSGTLAGANAAGLMLVDSLQNLTATETLVNSASAVVANTVAS